MPLPTPGVPFTTRKQAILTHLSAPAESYTDASPKGSVDAGIRHLIDALNAREGLVTTSSCAGRVSVYLEGRKTAAVVTGGAAAAAGVAALGGESPGEEGSGGDVGSAVGGKGGGEWLFVSHDPVEGGGGEVGYEALLLGREAGVSGGGEEMGEADGASRLIHFKFEPMILHVLTASLEHAQLVVQAGMEAGFRETGAVSLLSRLPGDEAMPVVAVRSMGLSFESLIGSETDGVRRLLVSPQYLKTLVQIANERFTENEKRIARFSAVVNAAFSPPKDKEGWEDAQARRERKREEGLRRREQLKKDKPKPDEEHSVDFILQQPDVL